MTDLLVGLAFTIGTFFILLILYFSYYFQDRRTGLRAQLYRYAIIINAVLIISELISSYLLYDKLSPVLGEILLKFHWFTGVAYFYTFYFYNICYLEELDNISKKELFFKRKDGKIITAITILFSLLFFVIQFKDLDYHALSYLPGLPAYIVFTYAVIIVMVTLFKYLKKKNKTRYEIAFSILFVLVPTVDLILQIIWLNIAFSPTFMAFLLLGCYFLLENPDLYVAKELESTKKRLETINNHRTSVINQKGKLEYSKMLKIAQSNYELLNNNDTNYSKDVIHQNIYSIYDVVAEYQSILDMLILDEDITKLDNYEYSTEVLLTMLYDYAITKIGEDNVQLTFDIDPFLPLKLYGCESMIYSSLIYSLNCAINSTKSGDILFRLKCNFTNNYVQLVIDITDNGNSLTSEDIAKINSDNINVEDIDRLEQYSLSKKFANYLNGSYNIATNLKGGTTISISVNQSIVDSTKIQEFSPIRLDYNVIKPNRKILIVDNNPQDLVYTLSRYKLSAEVVSTFEECVNKIKMDDSFTTVFVNINIQNDNAINTLKSIMVEHQNVANKIIALSSNAIPGIRSKYLAQGYDYFITKPYNEFELDDIIKNI